MLCTHIITNMGKYAHLTFAINDLALLTGCTTYYMGKSMRPQLLTGISTKTVHQELHVTGFHECFILVRQKQKQTAHVAV